MTKFHRISLRLYREDAEYLKLVFGRGYSEQLRDIIHQEINGIKSRVEGLKTEAIEETGRRIRAHAK